MKVLKSIKILLLLCYLFSFVLSDYEKGEKLTFSNGKEYNEEGTKSYEIKFSETLSILDPFLKIKITSTSNNNPIVLLSEEEKCLDKRKAFANQQYGPINLFINKYQVPGSSLFLCVKCQNEDICKYKINFDSAKYCQLNLGEQTSYYVDPSNEQMKFMFKANEEDKKKKVNIWAKGQNIASTNLYQNQDEILGVSFGFGDIYIAGIKDQDSFLLTVDSKNGDFVTVGSLLIEEYNSKILEVNDLEIMGMLNNDLRQLCFPIKQYEEQEDFFGQINGMIYTKKAKTFLSLDGEHEIDKEIEDGLIYDHIYIAGEREKERKFCISYLDSDEEKKYPIIFAFQLTSNVYKINNQYTYAPQLPGVIYSHYLPKGGIAVFRGMKPKKGAKEMNFNMKAIKGFPDMYFHRAKDFPETVYDASKLEEGFENPHHSNRITVYNFNLNETDYIDYNPLSKNQPLIVVHCVEGPKEEEYAQFCEFETSIFSDLDRINLIEKDSLSQYLFPGEVDLYTINIEKEKDLAKVYLDLIIFSGDVDFEIETESISKNAHKYFLSNKIFYSISVKENDKVIDFKVTAQQKSFYLIQYQLVRNGDESNNINKIESGINYIQSIFIGEGADYMKYVDFENLNYEQLSPFLINFYSENCQYVVSRLKEKDDGNYEEEYFTTMEDNYGQIIIDESDGYFDKDKYRFRIDITGDDASEYNKKLCMFYITGLELSNTNDGSERTISVSEGVPQRYIFSNNYPSIKYSYHISDINKPVIINFNLIDKGIYNVKILHNNEEIKKAKIYRNQQLLVYNSELKNKCKNNGVCTINIFLDLENKEENKRFEITIYQVNGAPIYLEKNVVKQDILIGSLRKYYYFDIGQYETGDINIDYIRGSGYIYATIVSKTSSDKMPNPDWRGIYQFPKEKKDSFSYETYLKKIPITKGHTSKCEDGCYILITVESSLYNETREFNEKDEFTPYRITITPRVYPKDAETSQYFSEFLIPRVRMSVNHFVLGNVFNTNDKILTYYQVELPYDSDYVIFDWQADKPSLYINVGDERPGIKEHDFAINSVGHDTVYKLSKKDIISKAQSKNLQYDTNTLKNYTLTLGIWTHELDTLYTSMYAFKLFMPKLYNPDGGIPRKIYEIIHIRSDQKVQCQPEQEEDTYSCVFAVVFDDCDVGKNLVVYPKAQKENIKVTFFGYKIDAEKIEKNNMEFINSQLKSSNKDYSSDNKDKYIYYENIEKSKCILFEVKTSEKSIIEVLSSTYLIKEESSLVLNPSTPQVFSIGDKRCYFKFETSQDLLINIVSISGDGYFIWEKEEEKDIRYILSGFEDRLTLTSGTSEKENQLSRLVAQSTTFTIFEKDESGFVFYVSFYPRNQYANIDQVKIGRSTEFNYREVSFPLNFYTKLGDQDIAISFTFYNYYLDKEYKLEYDKQKFDIWGKVISEEEALTIRMREDLRPTKDDAVFGSFDGSFGTLFLNQEDIQSYNVPQDKNPYIFFSVEPKLEESIYFNGLSMEVSISNENDKNYFAPEYVYLNGKFSNKNKISNSKFVYKLRTDSLNPFMTVEFSSNGNLVKWEVSTSEFIEDKMQNEKVYLNGRYLMIFKVPDLILDNNSPLYLIVYTDEEINPILSNYVFKYMNGKSLDSFFVFEQEKDLVDYNITIKNGKKSYTIAFYPVEQYDVNYYVKGVYKDSRIPEEIKDTIAISESEGYYLQVDNPDFEIEKQIKFVLDNVPKDLAYIKILAKVNFYSIKEYLLYKPIDIFEEDEEIPYIPFVDLEPNSYIKYNYDKTKRTINLNFKKALKSQTYHITFNDKNEIPNYIKIQAKSSDESINKNLYFTPEGVNGKREQLAQSGVANTVVMWIKREQLQSNNLYTTLECQIPDEQQCSYSIQITGYNYAIIDSYIFNYNYYVSENNKEMKFRINNDLGIEKTKDQILTLYANGGKKIKLYLSNCIDNSCKQYNFRTGAAITTKIQSHNYFELTIQAEVGDYLSVGSKVTGNDGKPLEVNGETIDNVLKPNGNQYTGYLKKYILENECYLIPNNKNYGTVSYIVAIFYNKVAQISFKDIDFNDVGEKEVNEKGYYTYVHNSTNFPDGRRYICIGFPDYSFNYIKDDLAYSIQLTQPKEQIGLINFYAPQLSGNIYPRIIPKDSAVIFNGANLNTKSENIIYNMIAIEGLPKMYIYKCSNYPLCDFYTKDEEEREKIFEINEINRMATWLNTDVDKSNSPIDAEQYIMVVQCENLNNSLTNVCQFQTSIYGNKDEIYLIEKQSFSQYLLKNNKARYVIELTNDNSITKVHVDIFVVNGDVDFDLKDELDKDIESHKYYLANKIFYSVNLEQNLGLNKIYIHIKAKVHSYYAIEYKFVKDFGNELSNDIYNGINYLIPISPSKGANVKIVNIHNVKLLINDFYFASFYSLNCNFNVKKIIGDEEQEITAYVNYAQDITHNDDGEDINKHSYVITALETDISRYKNNMCMILVSGLEITQEKDSIAQKDILISDGVPQRTVFQHKLNKIKYIYPNPDRDKNVAVYFKVINPAYYSYVITFNHYDSERKEFSQSNIQYLDQLVVTNNCKENELCNIIITVYVNEEIEEFVPILEVTVKQINNIPYYIPKGIVKQDFIPANSSLYLYTTLGQDDEGYITVDFARGSGFVYAKIVEINGKGDENPDWRQFKFPKEQKDSLYYEFYNKRIIFANDKTDKCEYGCYLLITLLPSVEGKLDEQYRFYPFSITVGLTPNGNLKQIGSIIKIEPEEYVVGSLSKKEKIKTKDMYEFYQISIPYDADKVEFDWQSDSAILLINVGEERPTLEGNHFIYNKGRSDSIFELSNQQIKDHLEAGNYITNAFLTIGVYTEDYESQFGTAYSFRVHFSKDLNIYRINSDQKTLCKPDSNGNNEYRCLFMITYSDLDFINDLMIYAKSQSLSASTNMYGKFIDKTIYDSFKLNELKENIPNDNSTSNLNTKRQKVDFIFLTLSELEKHFYVSVISDKPDIIEFITSFKTFDTELSPNPSSVQLFAINNYKSMKLKFKTTKGIIINIVSLYGNSKIYIEDEPTVEYSLRGRDDGLSLAIPANEKETMLIVEDKNYKQQDEMRLLQEEKMDLPSLAFYIEYHLRSIDLNFDEIILGKTAEFIYKKSDFPLYYYSKLNDFKYNVNTFFILHDLVYEKETNETKSDDIELRGIIIKEKTVYLVKVKEESKPNVDNSPIIGSYDPALQVGQIFFTSESIKNFNIKEDEKPTIYLSFEKKTADFIIKKIRMELTAVQENSDSTVTEKIYQYGKLYDDKTINSYKLKVDNSIGDMRIQFSSNNKNIDFAINTESNKKENMTLNNKETKRENGIIYITFRKPEKYRYLYLNVFLKGEVKNKNNNNYVFKYINSDNRNKFFEYKIMNNANLNVIKGNDFWEVKFNKIDSKNVDVIYSLKGILEGDYISNEDFNTIALTQSKSTVVKAKNLNTNEITLKLKKGEYSFVQVIAQIRDGPITEYVAYNCQSYLKEDKKSNSKTSLYIVIGISIGLFILVVILVIVIFSFNAKNKDLMEQVNKISFVSSGAKPKDDTNLLLDNQNELD